MVDPVIDRGHVVERLVGPLLLPGDLKLSVAPIYGGITNGIRLYARIISSSGCLA